MLPSLLPDMTLRNHWQEHDMNTCCRVGMIFLPNDDKLAEESMDIVKHVVAKEGQCKIKAWRDVPVDREVVGRLAKLTEPRIVQVHLPLFSV